MREAESRKTLASSRARGSSGQNCRRRCNPPSSARSGKPPRPMPPSFMNDEGERQGHLATDGENILGVRVKGAESRKTPASSKASGSSGQNWRRRPGSASATAAGPSTSMHSVEVPRLHSRRITLTGSSNEGLDDWKLVKLCDAQQHQWLNQWYCQWCFRSPRPAFQKAEA